MLADAHGNVIHLGERDCSIQRRHQKIVEETPSPVVTPELRERIGAIGVEAARAVGYINAGTVEGLLAGDGTYYFLEMNTRLQVEHTITEEVTGLDLVREQLRIAAGEPLAMPRRTCGCAATRSSAASTPRIRARDFVPTPGLITRYREPSGRACGSTRGCVEGSAISELYDPMVAKLIVWDQTRELARRRMLRALAEFEIGGVKTLIPIHRAILEQPAFIGGRLAARVRRGRRLRGRRSSEPPPGTAAACTVRPSERVRTVVAEVDGQRFEVTVGEPEHPGRTRLRQRRAELAERRRAPQRRRDVIRARCRGRC